MVSLRAGIDTFRFWQLADRSVQQKSAKVDAAALLMECRDRYPNCNILLGSLERDGIAVVPDYWSAEKCAVARSEIDRLIETHPDVVQRFSGGSDKRMFGVEAVSP